MDSSILSKHKKKDEFKISHKNEEEDEKLEEEDLQKRLELDIENDCNSEIKKIYVDKLEIKEIPDKELLLLDKQEIIDHKNYQIQKLKAYIVSLEKEKEDLINNYKETTNFLLEKIKQDEFNEIGIRPQTAQIVDNIMRVKDKLYDKNNINNSYLSRNSNNNNKNLNNGNILNSTNLNNNLTNTNFNKDSDMKNKNVNVFNFEENKEYQITRCPNCTKEFPQDKLISHSLQCLRKNHTCKICKEVISEDMKKDHIMEWRSNEVNKISKIKF